MLRMMKNRKAWFWMGSILSVGLILFFMNSGSSNTQKGGGGFAMRVVVEPASIQDIQETISLVGTLAANESVELTSETEGKVEKINFKEGQWVQKGRLLFLIDPAKLSAQAAQAEANYNLSKSNLIRSETLFEEKTVSKQENEQAVSKYESDKANFDLMRQQLKDATIRAPFSGTVGARLVSPGQVVTKGTLLSTLTDSHLVKVEFNVPERYAGKLSTGLSVNITVASYPDQTFTGKVYFVSPVVDPVNRTVLAKAEIPNKEGKLQPGMFTNLNLELGTFPNAVVIPEAALLKQGDLVQVYVATKENKADIRTIKIGTRLENKVQILEGVQGGELVVTEGIQKIGPGSPLTFDSPEDPKSPS